MAKTLSKNLHLCFSMIKSPYTQTHITDLSSNKNNNNHSKNNTSFNHYNSLYEEDLAAATTSAYHSAPPSPSSSDTSMADAAYHECDGDVAPATPDLAAVYASRRFFISSPGRSNSIVDSLSLSSLSQPEEEEEDEATEVAAGGVAVQTYSPDPYADFLRSMQEMVEARDIGVVLHGKGSTKEAWDYLQELLLSYLSLNPKDTHKYIVGAFTDLVLSLMSPNNDNNACSSSSSSMSPSSSSGDDKIELNLH